MLTSFVFLISISWYSQAQVIIEYSKITEYTQQEVQDILTAQGIPEFLVPVYYGVDVYRLTYNTPNVTNTGMTIASGAVAFPKGYMCDIPVASYSHGTVSSRYNVPSYESAELQLGILWASRGYATCLADYLGLGDSPGFHPYIHADSEASATVDMIRATKELGEELDINLGEDLFLFGYSQGGHTSMATYKMIQEDLSDEMVVTQAIPMSGPYDVSGVQTDFINSGVPYATPGYLPYVFFGLQEAYGNLYTDIDDVLVPPYNSTIPPLFDGNNGIGYINGQCAPIPTDMVVPSYQADFESDPNHPFNLALKDNDLIDWTPMSPLKLFYCFLDEQVYYENSEVAYDAYKANGAPNVQKRNFGNFNHSECLQYCMLEGIKSMDSLKTGPFELFTSVHVTEESSTGANDGSIIILGAESTTTFLWSNGSTQSTLSNIGIGNYDVTVTSDSGCSATYNFDYNSLVPIVEVNVLPLEIYPNPVVDYINIQMPIPSNYSIDILDVNGKKVFQKYLNQKNTSTLIVNEIPKGIYFIQVKDEDSNQFYSNKFLKK